MMRIFLTIIFYIVCGIANFSAQGCSDFYYFRKDIEIVFIQYDAKGKILGRDVGSIQNANIGEDIALSDYPIIKYNTKGRANEEFLIRTFCIKNNLKINLQIPDLPGITNYLSYPSEMKIGQLIGKDINKSFKIKVGDKETEVFFTITDRKVIGKEMVKTPAGEFKSEKIQYNLNLEYNVAGTSIPLNKKILEWFSPGFGIVKKESYNNKGILEEYSVLSSVH